MSLRAPTLGLNPAAQVLNTEGLQIHTALDMHLQRLAEQALRNGLAELEKRHPRLRAEKPADQLQGCLIAIQPQTGAIKAMAYERESWWSDKPVVHVVRRINPTQIAAVDPGFEPLVRRQSQFADWTPANTGPHEETVEAYSNCEEVELLLNGKSLGSKPRNADDSPRIWKVAWEPGTLKAIGRIGAVIVAEHELRTAGKPVKIMLAVDRTRLTPVWDDVAFVTATITDQNGVPAPAASDLVSFKITGPGFIAAVDSGDNSSVEPFQASARRAYQGRCYAMVKAGATRGKITLAASAAGLTGASISIEAASAPAPAKK